MLKPGYGSTLLTSGHLPQVCVLSTRVVFQQGRSTLLCLHRRSNRSSRPTLCPFKVHAFKKHVLSSPKGSRSPTPRLLLINFEFSILRLNSEPALSLSKGQILDFDSAEKPPFILREPQDERRTVEIMGDFSVHAERVEAFLGFFSIIRFWIPTLNPFYFEF